MKKLISFIILIIFISSLNNYNTHAQFLGGFSRKCYGNYKIQSMSIYQNFSNNVYSLISKLGSESSSSHASTSSFFYNTSVGNLPSIAYGSYVCRGDLNDRQCQTCVSKLTDFLSEAEIVDTDCYGVNEPELHCIVHFSNTSIVSVYEEGRALSIGSIGGNVTHYRDYNETLSSTVQGLIRDAEFGNWTNPNFETKEVKVTRSSDEKIYILVQCTPDISSRNCSRCLRELYSQIPKCCPATQGGYIAYGNCLMKYNNVSFFGSGHLSFMLSFWHIFLVLAVVIYLEFMYTQF